jgi:hypothetical protein
MDEVNTITEEQYKAACKTKAEADHIIHIFHAQKRKRWKDRYEAFVKEGKVFTDDELIFASVKRCPCGHGLAYPKGSGPTHHWDCAGILKGEHTADVKHTAQLPFAYYSITSETSPRSNDMTTRGTINLRKLPK